jgi:hypothetical protein
MIPRYTTHNVPKAEQDKMLLLYTSPESLQQQSHAKHHEFTITMTSILTTARPASTIPNYSSFIHI